MINAKEFAAALKELQENKNIPTEIVIEALKEALVLAYQQRIIEDKETNVEAVIDDETYSIHLVRSWTVVEEVNDIGRELTLDEGKEKDPSCEIGSVITENIEIDSFQRMAASYVKQILKQKLREAEKAIIYEKFANQKDDILQGIVERVEPGYIIINIHNIPVHMPIANKIPNEIIYPNQPLAVYIKEVSNESKAAQVVVTRNDPGFLNRLFEREITEVYSGTVEIRKTVREPGERAKVAVSSTVPGVEAAGACIGVKGMRIQKISDQLNKEKIDVVEYREEPELFVAEALKPAMVLGVLMETVTDELGQYKKAIAIVPNDQYSLAIGKKGVNVRLAAKITDMSIEIKTVDEALSEGIAYQSIEAIKTRYALEYALEKKKSQAVSEESVTEEVVREAESDVIKTKEEKVEVEEKPIIEPIEMTTESEMEEILSKMPTPKIKGEYIPVVEKAVEKPEIKVEEPKEKKMSNKAKKKEEEAKAKAREEEAKKNYMPVYTEEELKAIEEEDAEGKESKYDDDVDFDDFDDYYD